MKKSAAKPSITSDSWLIPLIFVGTFIAYYFSALPLMDDPDVPWHLAAGRLLLQTHQLPANDPWSYVSQNTPWYLLSWLWDLILGIVEWASGAFGVFLFTLALTSAVVAAIASRLLKLPIARPAAFLTILLSGLCMLDFITARPQIAGYAFTLVFYALLHESRGSGKYGKLLWLPPLVILWSNMHGSFVVAFSLLGAHFLEAWIAGNRGWCKRIFIIAAACGVCALMNPYGLDILSGAMRTLGGVARKYTYEWMPFTFTNSAGLSTWLILFLLVGNLRIKTVPLATKILAIAWMIATLYIMRNGAIAILVSSPYLAACMDLQTEGLREDRPPSAFMRFMERQSLRNVWAASFIALVAFIAVMTALPHEDRVQSPDFSAADSVAYAEEHYPNRHYLADFNFGGQIVYYGHGKLAYFLDSRAGTAFTDDVIADYLAFLWLSSGWEKGLKPYKVDAMLVSNILPFAKAYGNGQYHDHWKLVFAGKATSVYIARP